MMRRIMGAAALLLVAAAGARAQDEVTIGLWEASTAVGELKDYTESTSWRGGSVEFKRFSGITRDYSIGLSLGWHYFEDKVTGTTQIEGGAVTGTQRRWVNTFPVMFAVDWYFGHPYGMRAFLGAGAGFVYSSQELEIGVRGIEATNWHLGVAPEAGLLIPGGDTLDLVVRARYNHAFPSGDSVTSDKAEYGYFSFGAGLAFKSW